MDQIAIRFAIPKDSSDIFNWRNDDLSRIMAPQSDVVEWKNHQKWFQSTFDNEIVVAIRFDLNDSKKEAKNSINLSQKLRGKGNANLCLKSTVDILMKE